MDIYITIIYQLMIMDGQFKLIYLLWNLSYFINKSLITFYLYPIPG